jgi:hypothetical protein
VRHYLGQVDDLDIKAAASIAEISSLAERADGSIVVAMPMVVVAKEFGARAGSTYTGQGADRYAVVTREDAQRVGAPILADPWAAYQAGQALPGPQAAQVKGRRIPIPQEGRRWVPWAIVGGGMAVALGAMFVLSSKKSVKPNRRRSSRRIRRNASNSAELVVPDRLKPTRTNAYRVHNGVAFSVFFRNGWGASVASHDFSHGGKEGLWEVAVLNDKGELDYTTYITNDVIGWLDNDQVVSVLEKVAALPKKRWWMRSNPRRSSRRASKRAITRNGTAKRLSQNPKRRSSGGKEPVTKKGKYGTMYLYEIHFEDDYDPAQPEWMRRTMKYGYDREHAIQRFYDSYFGDPGDVQVKSAKRVLR